MFISKRAPLAPLYSTLTNLQLVLDATGLRDNTTNAYGQVTTGNVQVWNSISGALTYTTQPSGVNGESNTLRFQDGYVEFPGFVVLRSSTSEYNPLSFASPVGNLKNTIHMVLRMGQKAITNWTYGLFGNNVASASNKGTSTLYEDRGSTARTNGLTSPLSKGSAGFIILNVPDNLITPNVPFIYSEETDMSLAAADRRKHYINGVLFAYTGVSASTAVVTAPSLPFEVGGIGNGVLALRGWISHFIWQTAIESSGTFNAFVASLVPFTRKSNSNYFFNIDESHTYSAVHTLATAGQYYFVQGLLRKPTDENKLLKIYHNGTAHLYDAAKKVSQQTSTDGGRTWGAETNTYDEDAAGAYAAQDGEWGWESTGRIHGITDWHTAIATPGGTHKLMYHFSDDDGASYTTSDITSAVPSDGLLAFRAHGNIVEGGDGFLYGLLYKTTEEDDGTQTALYFLRKPVGSSTTWTALTIKAPGAAPINESSVQPLSNTTLLVLSRHNTSAEWNQYIATSNGTSVTDQGAITFGETRTSGSPPLLIKIQIHGVDVIGAVLLNKEAGTKNVQVVYGTCANLLASGLTGWDLDTKHIVYSGTFILHYGRVAPLNNGYNGLAAFALEPNPFTGLVNTLVTFHWPSFKYYLVKTQLGIVGH